MSTTPTALQIARCEAAIEVLGLKIAGLNDELLAEQSSSSPDAARIATLRRQMIDLADRQETLDPIADEGAIAAITMKAD